VKNYESIEDQFEEAWNSPYSVISNKEIERSWKKFPVYLRLKEKRGYVKAGLAAVAVMILLFTSYFFLEIYNPIITVVNFSQVEKEVRLSDGSLVLLKKDSEIRYNENFRNSRGVELKGEAFFKVEKDSMRVFKVVTGSTTTKVLGTSFSVIEREEGEIVEIFLYTGRVMVSVKGKAESWGLIPGESFVYSEGKAYVEKFDTNLSFESGNQFIDINNLEIEELFKFLEKRFDYEFDKNHYTKNKRVTLRVNKKDSLEQILKLLSIINNTTYEINQEKREIQVFSK
jgi:ferric-dicitrate binding protein FerR (iron transport regulator)